MIIIKKLDYFYLIRLLRLLYVKISIYNRFLMIDLNICQFVIQLGKYCLMFNL